MKEIMKYNSRIASLWLTILSASAALGQTQDLSISELMAINNTTLADEDGSHPDWLEIHNAGSDSVDLEGWYLTDNASAPDKWRFPHVSIPPDGYLVVFASDKNRAVAGGELHTNFQMTSNGEYLGLIGPDGVTVIHKYTPSFPLQYPDVSYGIVAGSEAYMVAPSPGATNIEGGLDHVSPVNFSLGRGFYAQPFEVSLTTLTPDAEIRYTLDGSAPTLSQGSIYSGPIPIDKTRVLRAAAFKPGLEPSTVETQTYLFLSSVLNQTYPGGGWPAPGTFGPRNQLMDYDMDSEVINDPRYSDRVDDALLSLPTLSLVTDLTHLFNPSTDPAIGGIYANPNQDGSEWERPVSMELIHPDNTPGFQIDAGIRIRGGWSRGGSNPKHAFRFFFRSKYGESRLNYPLFGEEGVDSFDKIDLRCSTDYSWNLGDADGEGYGSLNTQTRDVFCRDTQRDMGQPYTRSRQYHVYLNGLYWGMYQSQERSEAAFAEDYLGGDESDYDAITRRSYSEGAVDGNLEAWTELWQKTIAGFTTDESYYAVQGLNPDGSHNPLQKKLVDLENLIDYMTIIYYTGSFDTPVSWWWSPDNAGVNNIWCLFNRIHPDGFKYFCHDCEHTLLAHLKSYPNFPWSIDRVGPFDHPRLLEFDRANPQTLHQNLLSHPAYRKIFQDRIYQHFFNDGALTPEAATARFQSRIEEIDLAIIAESARWGDAQQTPLQPPRTKDDDFVPTVNGIVNEFFPTRAQVVLDQLRARGWYPNAHPPTPLVDGFENRIGHVPTGSEFSLDNPNGYGRMYFTTDGSDPWVEPSQRRAVSFVAEDAIKQVLIPSGPLLNWNEIGFDDGAWTHGSIDRVLEFDGVDDSADFGTEPGSAGALTVAFWVYANHGDEYVILDKYPNDASGIGWRVRLRGDAEMQFRIGSSGSNTNIELDRAFLPRIWTHISCTFENGTAKVYFDGVERTSRSGISQSVQNISTPLRMGTPSAVDTGLKFEGRLNDVRLYDRALTPLEIADLVNHQGGSDGLTAHWKLDEASGETVSDSSGDGHVGTLFGNPVWRLASLGGIGYDQGTEFDTTIGTDVEVEMRGQNTSAYLRIPFLANTEDLGDLHFLNLRVKFDAGFVAYLNGQKVADAGSPATPEWNSSSPSERDDAEARLFRNYDLSSAIGSLVAGENLLALQGLNSASEDEDFLLSVELIGQDIHPDTEINPKAIEYSGPIDLFESLQIKSRVLDIGEWSPLEKATYSVGPVTESLRISEVHYHPLSASEAEFIELKNIGAETLQLNLVRFTEGIDFTFPSIALPPGELVVIVANLAVFEAVYGSGLPVAGVYSGRLDNAGERIRLEDALGEGILDFEFIDQWHPSTDGGNRSLTRLDLAVTDPENWGQEEGWIPSSVDGGTPGLDDSGPFESPTPSPTSTPSPTPSWTPSLTPTVTHSATSTPSESATWTSTPTWTPTPSDSPTPTPTASPSATATYLYDWTGEGDVNAMDLVLILKDLPNTEYLYGFAAHWNLLESR